MLKCLIVLPLSGLLCNLGGCGTTGATAEQKKLQQNNQQCESRGGEIMERFNRTTKTPASVGIEGAWKCESDGQLLRTTIVADSEELALQVRYRMARFRPGRASRMAKNSCFRLTAAV